MPDFPRPDLIGIDVKVSCNKNPGCTPETPCPDCLGILTGEGYCRCCVPAAGRCEACGQELCEEHAEVLPDGGGMLCKSRCTSLDVRRQQLA